MQGETLLLLVETVDWGIVLQKKCVSEGAQVIITGRNEEQLQSVSNELKYDYIVFDSKNIDEIENVFELAENIFGGKTDSLISNAGISLHEGDFRNVTEQTWDDQMDTNIKGNYFLVQKFIQYLESKQDKSGNIIVITSEKAKRSDDIPYGLTKAAASSFVQCIASKVANEGIRINGVGPGVTATDMTGAGRDGDFYSSWTAGHRYFMPEEIAEVVNFLLSDISACISGEIITCDQGSWVTRW